MMPATLNATNPASSKSLAGLYCSAVQRIVFRKRVPSRTTLNFERPDRSAYGIGTSTTFSPSCSERVLMTGVKFSPSGSGYSCFRQVRLSTRIPLAGSSTREFPITESRLDQMRLPRRRTGGILLSAPDRREPITTSAPSRMTTSHSLANCSGG